MLEVAARLTAAGIDYAVIGAMAAAVHGVVRASLDADAVVSLPAREARTLQRVLADPELIIELRTGDAGDSIPALLAVSDHHGNRVDVLIGLRGLDPEAFKRARNVPFLGNLLRVVGQEDFVAMKLFAGGAQDLVDARQVLALHRETLDMDLLRRLALSRRAAGALRMPRRAAPRTCWCR